MMIKNPSKTMISLQVPDELMKSFDNIKDKMGFSSRSDALRKSIEFFIQSNQDSEVLEGHKIANITVIHDLREDIMEKFEEISIRFSNIIKSVNQYNLKRKLLKSTIVSGNSEEIKDYYNSLSSERTFNCTLTYIIVPE
jgi:CopG family transcriptional regulator, nickel-responsive regulator